MQKRNLENFGAEILSWKFRVLGVFGLDSSLNEKQIFCEKLGCKLKKVLF
jgi:hypothetical protein